MPQNYLCGIVFFLYANTELLCGHDIMSVEGCPTSNLVSSRLIQKGREEAHTDKTHIQNQSSAMQYSP